MGAKNVSGAYALWPHVSDRPHRLLVGMSLTSLDEASDEYPARHYWRGRKHMAALLGMPLPAEDDDSDEAEKARESVYEKVRRARQVLERAGAITCVVPAVHGRNAVYRVNVDAMELAEPVDKAGVVVPFPLRKPQRSGGAQPQRSGGAKPQRSGGA